MKIFFCLIILNKVLKSKLKWDLYVVFVMCVVNKFVVGRIVLVLVFRVMILFWLYFCCNVFCWYGVDEDSFVWVDSCFFILVVYWLGIEEVREMVFNLEIIFELFLYLFE